jgi:NADH:flavin oxidoreductases, Old Yellow Enzyme family
MEEHRLTTGSDDGLLIGLQLTHSGRFSRPNAFDRPEPRIAYHHPILDARLGLSGESPLLTDSEIDAIIEKFIAASTTVRKLGFDFVDLKHCHGYLGHELLSAHTRKGRYGGSFENRTRFLRNLIQGIRANAPGIGIGVRLSAFDTVPFRHGESQSPNREAAPGIPEGFDRWLPYRYGFGVNPANPVEIDLAETTEFVALLEELGVRLVNVTAGSPYYNPHIQRPALYPPSDGYAPPEDPLIGVARQMDVTRALKHRFPNLIFVGSAYSYLQDFLPNVAQAALRLGWVDSVGLGRMLLTYPEILWDATEGRPLQRKRICRTFSDCTTAPRKGLPSGCYPLDDYYKDSPGNTQLQTLKKQ